MIERLKRYLRETEKFLCQWNLDFPDVNVYYSGWLPYSYFSAYDGTIVICKAHLRDKTVAIQTLLHEAFHYYLEKYNIQRSHAFRVRQSWLPYWFKTTFYRFLYDDYDQVDCEEGRCELFGEMLYYGDPDLRFVSDEKKRKQVKAMRLMIEEISEKQIKQN